MGIKLLIGSIILGIITIIFIKLKTEQALDIEILELEELSDNYSETLKNLDETVSTIYEHKKQEIDNIHDTEKNNILEKIKNAPSILHSEKNEIITELLSQRTKNITSEIEKYGMDKDKTHVMVFSEPNFKGTKQSLTPGTYRLRSGSNLLFKSFICNPFLMDNKFKIFAIDLHVAGQRKTGKIPVTTFKVSNLDSFVKEHPYIYNKTEWDRSADGRYWELFIAAK